MGRLITVPLLVFGLLLIALPTFVLGREFSSVWDLMKESQVSAPPLCPNARLTHFPPVQTSEDEVQEHIPTPLASPMVRQPAAGRSTWDVRLDSLAAEAMMPLGQMNRRQTERDRAELVSQISELRAAVEAQGELIRRMMDMLDGKGKQRAVEYEEERAGPWS